MNSSELEWTEKYRPERLEDVAGNPRQRYKLLLWAEGWNLGCPLGKCTASQIEDEIMKKRAILLAGPPGIGKTTSALALAREMGWTVIEMNASDTRNADAVKRIALSGAITQGFTEEGDFASTEDGRRKLIILDEADNLSGNADRGGIKAIIDVVKRTSQPVILIANDLYSLQRRSSFFKKKKSSPIEIIQFERPDEREIRDFLLKVVEKEGLDIDRSIVGEIARRAAGDVRGALNDLQSFAYSDASFEDFLESGVRDRELSMVSALWKLYSSGSISSGVRYLRAVDEEPSSTMLWLDELIPRISRNYGDFESSMLHLSNADIYLARVWRRQQYSLWKYATEEMAASVVLINDKRKFPDRLFPVWLSFMGRSKGSRNLRKSISLKLAVYLHTTSGRVMQDILLPFSILFRRDESFMLDMIWKLDLNEKEVSYLLDDPAMAKLAVERARHGRKRDASPILIQGLSEEEEETGNKDDSGDKDGGESEEGGERSSEDDKKKKKKQALQDGQTTLF